MAEPQSWLQPAAYIAVGLVAAVIATRNARKTPHENLRALVEIEDKLETDADPRGAVRTAIQVELTELHRLNFARAQGGWRYLWYRATSSYVHLFWFSALSYLALFGGLYAAAQFFGEAARAIAASLVVGLFVGWGVMCVLLLVAVSRRNKA